jgi:hypothetical protein
MVPLGPRDLVAASLAAVRGRVAHTAVARDGGTGQTWTEVTIDPTEYLFGTLPPGPIVLHELGGRVDGVEQRVFGGPEYRPGEDVIVFISSDRRGRLHTTGLAMGAYRIYDTLGTARAVRSFGAGVAVFDPARGTIVHDAPDDVLDVAALRRIYLEPRVTDGKPGARPASTVPVSSRCASHRPRLPRSCFSVRRCRWFEADDGLPMLSGRSRRRRDARTDRIARRSPPDSRGRRWRKRRSHWKTAATEPVPLGSCRTTRVMFNDRFDSTPTDCKGSWITVICDAEQTGVVNGKTFRRIISSKTLINDGFGTCPFWNPAASPRCSPMSLATRWGWATRGYRPRPWQHGRASMAIAPA